jgi:hypothetical protein
MGADRRNPHEHFSSNDAAGSTEIGGRRLTFSMKPRRALPVTVSSRSENVLD